MKKLLLLVLVLLSMNLGWGEMRSSITQEGITWTFDKQYECGQFANKNDWWVVGPVTITSITPDYTGTYNGWEVNPSSNTKQSFDKRSPMGTFTAPPSLPYTARAGESVVKVDSWEERDGSCKSPDKTVGPSGSYNHPCCVWGASVLTVLGEVPPDNGATVFRPPYFGTDKPLHSTTSLRTDLLPSKPAVPGAPTLQWVYDKYKNVFLDHGYRMNGYSLLPLAWTREYGGNISRDAGDAVMRLILDDPVEDKMDALIAFVQRGIDLYAMYQAGHSWPGAGGWGSGRKLPMLFAAVMLDDAAMKADAGEAATRIYDSPTSGEKHHPFHEDNSVYHSDVTGRALFGQGWNYADESRYWKNQMGLGASRDIRDPYGYIDGGEVPGGAYQGCCTSGSWRPHALACMLMPGLRDLWNFEPFIEYEKRWVNHGAWTLPDPCRMLTMSEYNAGDYGCKSGTSRWADKHGSNQNGDGYSSQFATFMWLQYARDEVIVTDRKTDFPGILNNDIRIFPHPMQDLLYFDALDVKGVKDINVVVYNDAGTAVRYLRQESSLPVLLWNGRDEQGQQVKPGVYFYSCLVDGKSITGKVVKVRQ